ncbi:MAG: CtsR family transcriptional regulator [Clostridiales bacterium]|nr:CtsR family transcriptional regulator [Clostridiales bacterium]MDY2836146.1 CtsR family transcriptional regulator [Candidatus Aphodomonas sp.]
MRPLTDSIEAFIKSLLEEGQEQVDVQRNELAQYFRCAPSQITYVLSTRFTPDHGYVIESRRGGGGYIRIVRLREEPGSNLLYLINQRIGSSISRHDCDAIISQLCESHVVTENEAGLMRAAVSADAINLPVAFKDSLRASTLRAMLLQIAGRAQKEG